MVRLHSTHGFGVSPAAYDDAYGVTTFASKSSEKLKT